MGQAFKGKNWKVTALSRIITGAGKKAGCLSTKDGLQLQGELLRPQGCSWQALFWKGGGVPGSGPALTSQECGGGLRPGPPRPPDPI